MKKMSPPSLINSKFHFSHNLALEFRLEPINDLNTDSTFGYEILSRTSKPTISIENLFREMNPRTYSDVFKKQITVVNNTPLAGRFFINMKAKHLTIELIKWVENHANKKLALEIDYKEITSTEYNLKHYIAFNESAIKLKELGHHIWLDDFDGQFNNTSSNILKNIAWDGIKLDKSVLWNTKPNDKDTFNRIVKTCASPFRKIIVEGIENRSQINICRQSGASFGQGFYWKSTQI